MSRLLVGVSIVLISSWSAAGPAHGADISYVYDALGRLVGVIDPASDTAVYRYDAVGNLLSIDRYSSQSVSIIDFTPDRGANGTTVTISGTGFSATASENSVTFNSVAAAVMSATPTEIVTTVPAEATTGPVGVTAPTGSATSASVFTVGSDVPTITSFTPTIGTPGTAVTIGGTNFEPNPANDKVVFNSLARSWATEATPTSVGTTVPGGTGSGRLSVATPAGIALSGSDFFIPPSPYTAGDVQVTARMAVGDDRITTFTTSNKIGILVFDAAAAQRVNLGTQSSFGAQIKILRPDGTTFATTTATGEDIDTQLPVAGTYSIVIDPDGTNTGSLTLSLTEPVSGALTADGPSLPITLRRGQDARISFAGNAGQWISLAASDVSTSISPGCQQWNGFLYLAILKPDGTTLASGFYTQCGGDLDVQLPASGTYTALVDTVQGRAGTLTLTLSTAIEGVIGPTDAPLNVTLRPGQDVRKTFSGTAGQWITFAVGEISSGLAPGCQQWYTYVAVAIIKPDGTPLASTNLAQCGGDLDVQLPTTGTYVAVIDAAFAGSGTLTVTLSEPINGAMTTTEPSLQATLRPGQDVRKTFEGVAGQWTSLAITNISSTLSPGCSTWLNYIFVAILKPDGSTLSSTTFTQCGGDFDLQLPVTGTYMVLVDPANAGAGSLTLTLSDAVAGTVVVNGNSVPAGIGRLGQDARITFDGTSGQQVTVRITANTMCGAVRLLKPDGTTLTSTTSCSSAFNLSTQTLPTSGVYTINSDPSLVTGNQTLAVTSP